MDDYLHSVNAPGTVAVKTTRAQIDEVKNRRNPEGKRTYHLKRSLEVKKSVVIMKKNKEIVAMDEKEATRKRKQDIVA